jgi:hypothetical protein
MALWGKSDDNVSKPKYLNDSDKSVTFGVSNSEAQIVNNRAAGLKTPGWTRNITFVDWQGNIRNKSEILVAFAGNIIGDANDDSIVGDRAIVITLQPASTSVSEGQTATFSVNVSVTPSAVATYQWQKQEAGTSIWSNIVVATSASYTTGALTAVDDNGDKYRVQISAPDTRAIVSAVATLEVTTSGTQSAIDLMLESGVEDLMLGSGVLDLQLDN